MSLKIMWVELVTKHQCKGKKKDVGVVGRKNKLQSDQCTKVMCTNRQTTLAGFSFMSRTLVCRNEERFSHRGFILFCFSSQNIFLYMQITKKLKIIHIFKKLYLEHTYGLDTYNARPVG